MRKVEVQNNGFVFANVEEGAKYYGIKVKQLQKHLDGKRKFSGKGEANERLYWQYANDNAKIYNKNYIDDNQYNEYMTM